VGDERSATTAGAANAREGARSHAPLASDPDLQTLLARAVVRLADETGCARVAAWSRDAQGRPLVLAARWDGPCTLAPDDAALRALEALARATDLGAAGVDPSLAALPREAGLAAAACLRAGTFGPVAGLLAGGPQDPAGRVRPRTLAALDAAAQRLALPVGAALAAQRLARLDAEVRRIDRLAALGERVAEIVHEIRNPLVSVKTFLQLLPDRAHDPEFRQSFFEVAGEELRRVERLLDVVLEHARPAEAGAGDACAPVAPTLAALARLVSHGAARAGVELEVDAADALPDAAIGVDALRQVVLNLLSNALAVSPAGTRVRLAAHERGTALEIDVEDAGPGVPPALRERIFEPFFSTRADRPGGLGLAISKRIVEEAGGSIAVEDAPGGGSRFRVSLPKA
jgi:signal transduction histidine kinase